MPSVPAGTSIPSMVEETLDKKVVQMSGESKVAENKSTLVQVQSPSDNEFKSSKSSVVLGAAV